MRNQRLSCCRFPELFFPWKCKTFQCFFRQTIDINYGLNMITFMCCISKWENNFFPFLEKLRCNFRQSVILDVYLDEFLQPHSHPDQNVVLLTPWKDSLTLLSVCRLILISAEGQQIIFSMKTIEHLKFLLSIFILF